MKRFVGFVIIIMLSVILAYNYMYLLRNKISTYSEGGISYISKLDNKYFYIYKYGKWEKTFIKGVNIGAAKPGAFPGELAITKEEYLRWFKQIAKMNANAIRVYTTLKPEFYEALYDYNKTTLDPLYVFQGVWVNEEDIIKLQNAENEKIKDNFKNDTKNLIDIIHGNAYLSEKRGFASGKYTKDVSPYVIGWILGIEWDPDFVVNTNELNRNKTSYHGKYLYTEKASPFENLLCEVGDFAIEYEMNKYGMQRTLSFSNWPTTDMLKHPNEPYEKEDMVSVNIEHIKFKENFKTGIFASYHIYPYYPDFMNYQNAYADFKDKDGKINTYRAYLKELIKEHNIPVLVAEFGVPASRGIAHENIHMGLNQGNISEENQGKMDAFMMNNIYEEGYAGGLIFTWQDEWFKRTWNTMDLDIADRRPYWSNPQTNEQEFGLLAFDPGNRKSICYVDGDIKDWNKDRPITENERFKLYTKSDEKYIYFMADISDFNFEEDKFLIPIDITPNSGNLTYNEYNLDFKQPMDFAILIDGKENSRVKVDAYYDNFYYIYSEKLKLVEENKLYEKKNNGIFNPIFLCLNRSVFLPETKETIPLTKHETGLLTLGNGNPKSKDYNSLADFYTKDNIIEIRIPWQIFNVMDPSTKMIMDDFYVNDIKPMEAKGFTLQGVLISEGNSHYSSEAFYSWEKWEVPVYHERLKPSYYILKDAFKELGDK